jgi:hypothetical protein
MYQRFTRDDSILKILNLNFCNEYYWRDGNKGMALANFTHFILKIQGRQDLIQQGLSL